MPLNAIIPLDKPYGWSSFDAIRYAQREIQRATGERKVKIGHAGTLDPLATGLLLVCVGQATKQAEQLQGEPKEYVANICLGATTPSFDLETEVVPQASYSHVSRALLEAQLLPMLGEQLQMPPQFSAKQVNGQRAYTLARKGVEVHIKPNTIAFHSLEVLHFAPPHVDLLVRCSKGTYIRSLAHSLGQTLGCGAYLCGLRRTGNGGYRIEKSVSIDGIYDIFC